MRVIQLGVIFDQQLHVGGGYQQALNAGLLACELPHQLVQVHFFTTIGANVATLARLGVEAECITVSLFGRAVLRLRRFVRAPFILRQLDRLGFHNAFERPLIRREIDLVYFLSPSGRARDLERLNYITTVWDLCHRDAPEFPEVRWQREFEAREDHYKAVLPRATAVLVDSPLGKANVACRYGIDEARIHVMPFQAGHAIRAAQSTRVDAIDVATKYGLDVPYVFYPAQFWAHKNHAYLLRGLKCLEEDHRIRVGAIFSGGDKGNMTYVKELVTCLGLEDRVRFAGFVGDEEIRELYCQSLALVMPTYFGPTNLPPLEAFELGVPVLYPDEPGLREQVGEAALLIDLTTPASMAGKLSELLENAELRGQLAERGRRRLQELEIFDHVGVLAEIVKKFQMKLMCWN
jgi:glycosyltransferase involved in cell wall biosynthesis